MSRRSGSRPRLKTIAIAAVGVASAVVACSLNLDESKIPVDAVLDGAPASDVAAQETAPPADVAPGSVYIPCKATPDCGGPPNACVTPRCDTARGVCVYDECSSVQGQCASGACNTDTFTCGSTLTTYGFLASTIALPPGPLGCNGAAARCFAASYPFVFVGTAGGIMIYPVANVGGAAPKPVPIDGIPFQPAWIVASGPRVWFLGSKVVSSPGFKQPIAWLDVPTDPTVQRLAASNVTLQTSQQDIQVVRPADDGAIFVTLNDTGLPTTRIQLPLVADASLSFYPLALPAQSTPTTTSAGRLVGLRISTVPAGAPWRPYFTLVAGAGTANAQSLGEVELTPFNLTPGYPTYASSGPNGGVVFAGDIYNDDPDAGTVGPKGGRLTWLLDDATTTKPSGTAHIDYAPYDPLGPNPIGPVTWLDSTTALVTINEPVDGGPPDTRVRAVSRTPSAVLAGTRVLTGAPTSYAYAGSNGAGYALGVDNTSGNAQPSIYVFAPNCK